MPKLLIVQEQTRRQMYILVKLVALASGAVYLPFIGCFLKWKPPSLIYLFLSLPPYLIYGVAQGFTCLDSSA